jgi:type I restriction-modification system DNA methylase subunit
MKEPLKQISNLVERFQRNIDAYHTPAYNETQLRREFVDPFFEALGWDVTNKAGYAEQYKDVIHEDAIKIAGATKAPDYCFRIGGVRKFFLETKKPSIDIKTQTSPAYQLRRYALREIFYHADDKYNSGLFDFETDRLTPDLKLDDKPLKDIFKTLYYPESPYEFSVLGADILGHVYEQFLGKVIRLTEGHRAKVEEKPEVRKAGGVYYTPTYIVDYIVKNTVGKICESKTPRQISSFRILDPACGSGSFLLGAYQYLLDYHRDWYQKDGPQKHTKEIYQGRGGQ